MAHLLEDFALRRQAHATAVRVSQFAGARLGPQDFLLPAPVRRTRFERAVHELIGNAGIIHVTVWNRQREVLYTDERGSPGQPFPQSPLLKVALDGQLQWQLISAAGQSPAAKLPRLEIFAPVIASGTSPVAVYEIVSDLTDLSPALIRLKWSVEVSVVLGVLFLYAVLFSIVRKASHDLERHQSALRQSLVGMIRSLVTALDARDMATGHHSSRVAENAVAVARAMGMSESAIREVQLAGFLHDVGKIGIPDDILTKQGPLTPEEWTIMERHTVFGYEILDPVPIAEGIKLAVRHSHERWDGRGYPDGLSGEQIPLAARVIAVADAYEALTTERSYRPAQSPQKAVEAIKRNAGVQFDPKVVEAFLSVWRQATALQGSRVRSSIEETSSQRPVRSQRVARGSEG